MAFELTDDGTMDTVLRCADCGQEERFNYDPTGLSDDDYQTAFEDFLTEHGISADHVTQTIRDQFDESLYDAFVEDCIEQAESDHECETDEDRGPQDDDITTEDHEKFYQNGRLVLSHASNGQWYAHSSKYPAGQSIGEFGDDYRAALKAYCDREQYWPNCWFISDHGNAHLMTD